MISEIESMPGRRAARAPRRPRSRPARGSSVRFGSPYLRPDRGAKPTRLPTPGPAQQAQPSAGDPFRILAAPPRTAAVVSRAQDTPESLARGEDFVLQLYLREALAEPVLTQPEELKLGARARAGDAAARERLVLSHLRLAVRLAFDYQGLGLPVSDLISEANIGLMIAADRFDPGAGARFATYSIAWIKQRIRRALSQQSRLVRLPIGIADCVSRVKSAEARLRASLGRAPTDDELAEDTDLVRHHIHRLRSAATQCYVSIDAATGPDEDAAPLAEILCDESGESPGEPLARRDDQALLERLLDTLQPREARVLRLRFGLDDGRERSLAEVGEVLGLVRQRVQQIEVAALGRLRKRARALEWQTCRSE